MSYKHQNDAESNKNILKNDESIKYLVQGSFSITYILLLTTATITIIEALRTKVPHTRHILNLETCISLVAGYFYSTFTSKIENSYKNNELINWSELVKIRYIDWTITTPLMLLVLSSVLSYNIKDVVHFNIIVGIVLINWLMILFGYLGENGTISRIAGLVGGFICFFIIFIIVYINYIKPKYNFPNIVLFGIYIVVWSLYGVAYMLDNSVKNIIMNILDLIAKCFVGLGLWTYYTHMIVK
jgi:bacteriorhodopsin